MWTASSGHLEAPGYWQTAMSVRLALIILGIFVSRAIVFLIGGIVEIELLTDSGPAASPSTAAILANLRQQNTGTDQDKAPEPSRPLRLAGYGSTCSTPRYALTDAA